jgi:magnesium transporter
VSLETKTSLEQIQGIEDRIAHLGTIMNEVNSFLTACINLRDSDIMKTQARRATELTALAVIYLPLTLVTGIFGMNLTEINGGTPKWWTSVIALVILGAATVIPFGTWIFLRRRHENLDRAKQMEGLI